MFEWLKKFSKILVTGPQRSGTRICARMIASDTGYSYVDEVDIHMDSLYGLDFFMKKRKQLVIQCPVLCRHIHHFSADNVAIIMMRRNVKDIIASQKRIGWAWEWLELRRYDCKEGNIAEVKYHYWKSFQKQKIKQAFEIKYEGLSGHQLWIPTDLRRKFLADQISEKENIFEVLSEIYPGHYPGVYTYEESDPGSALLIKTNQAAKKLNPTGKLIWKYCDGTKTFKAIFEKIKKHFPDVDEKTLRNDMELFFKNLIRDGFLQQFPLRREKEKK